MPFYPSFFGKVYIIANPTITRSLKDELLQIFNSAWLGESAEYGRINSGAYLNISETQLRLPENTTKESFIAQTIEDEICSWESDSSIRYYCMYIDRTLAGILSINLTKSGDNSNIYIRQLAIAVKYQNSGLGKIFLNYLHNTFPTIKNINVLTRKINRSAITFYEKNGYIIDPKFNNPHYSPNIYVAMSKKR